MHEEAKQVILKMAKTNGIEDLPDFEFKGENKK
jgi:hypothetical protein